jgi:hypothetical protein
MLFGKKLPGCATSRNRLRIANVRKNLYCLSDAPEPSRRRPAIIAHCIRDSVIDEALMQEMKTRNEMKTKNVVYIPTGE